MTCRGGLFSVDLGSSTSQISFFPVARREEAAAAPFKALCSSERPEDLSYFAEGIRSARSDCVPHHLNSTSPRHGGFIEYIQCLLQLCAEAARSLQLFDSRLMKGEGRGANMLWPFPTCVTPTKPGFLKRPPLRHVGSRMVRIAQQLSRVVSRQPESGMRPHFPSTDRISDLNVEGQGEVPLIIRDLPVARCRVFVQRVHGSGGCALRLRHDPAETSPVFDPITHGRFCQETLNPELFKLP
ncbi:hypothetical protein N656DRAFT_22470 [Canariomyces notabilis]|uniref:Uncharacterized protein n=1 Tax=Canariomyces notabilis TaxID=2074819 RepID=A0AAN6YX15_9PEZI|nr:hypothetical protein N656DRAFT_22470 [Canariomyces arenarius]